MAEDAMDWIATTPPFTHNPYLDPRYIPGEWPLSPPSSRVTPGVFAIRQQPTICGRATNAIKRICTGIKNIAVAPVKPIYSIVRDWNRRQRRSDRQSRRDQPRLQGNTTATKASTRGAKQLLYQEVAEAPLSHIATPPLTPPQPQQEIDIDGLAISAQLLLSQSPATASTTDTETTVPTPTSIDRAECADVYSVSRTGTKRTRSEWTGESDLTYPDSLLYPTIQDYLATNQEPPHAANPPATPAFKKMRGPNRFNAGYKRSPTAYGGRGASSRIRMRPIGTKIENPDTDANIWGGYVYEKPIDRIPTPPPSPGTSLPTHSESALHNPDVSEGLRISQPLTNQEKENENPSTLASASDKASTQGSTEPFDDRWASVPVLNLVWPEEELKPDANAKEQEANLTNETVTSSQESSMGFLKSLWRPQGSVVRPPPIRTRTIDSELRNGSLEQQIKPHGDSIGIDQESMLDTALAKEEQDADSGAMNERQSVKSELADNSIDKTSVTVPVTPLKVIAEKPAAQDLSIAASTAERDPFETPAQKLSKLKIKESEEDITPKATPHSGTKTQRVTRYREALEKAQKAKLEQYELVPINEAWDKKVRNAVRDGIPEYLEPHDLARVVPQYAGKGQDNWLNDETINKYLELVAAHGRKNDRPDQVRSHHAFNSFFYKGIAERGPASVARWSKRPKINGKNLAYVEKVFVPINSGAHWTLAVVEPTQKRITHYNSMRGAATGTRACEHLKSWVAAELGKDFDESEWTLTAVGESPQQTNSDDCGVFTITSARQIMLGYNPTSYGPAQIPIQRIRIVAELINKGLLRSTSED